MEATLAHAKGQIKWYNKEVNELIFSQPYIKPKLVGDQLNVTSRTTLTKYFNELVDRKILSPVKDGKELFYVNDDLIPILRRIINHNWQYENNLVLITTERKKVIP